MKESFLNYIAYTLCLSSLTVIKYRQVLDKFDSFLLERGKTVDDPENIEKVDVYNFVASMREAGLSPNYCNSFITGFKSYLNYLRDVLELEVIDPHRLRYSKVPERDVSYYNEKEKSEILNLVNSGIWASGVTRLRNKLLVYLFLHTGLRCHELVKIKVEDIGDSLKVRGKWGKIRYVFLRGELLDMIGEYLKKRKKKSEYLFPTHKSGEGHLYECSVRGIFFKMSHKLGFRIHPHKFRHTFATDLLHIPWANIYNVAKLLGHSRISTTQIYLWSDNMELKKLQFWLKYS